MIPVMAARIAVLFVGIALLLTPSFAHYGHEMVHFSYSGATGPNQWGSLSPHYAACSNGKLQSPIDIVKKDTVFNSKLKALMREYCPSNATLVNNGFNIELRYEPSGGVLVTDFKNYTLKHIHWHSPSEHRINGHQYPMELQLFHIANDGSISVVAILYQYGESSPLISQIQKNLHQLAKESCASNEEAHIPVKILKTKYIERKSRKYFRYIGSLTTPPCTENVSWNILGKVGSISKEQVAALKAPLDWAYQTNSRPAQPLNGRRIELYDELQQHQ